MAILPKMWSFDSTADLRRIDFENIECPLCGERFAPIRER
jgi:hypothetical protein